MYSGRTALVTGGLGFIGSNLVLRLVELGARVTVIDNLEPGCGGREEHIAGVRDRVRLIQAGIEDAASFAGALAEAAVVFNLAGEVSHTESFIDPERDLRINALAQLRFLRALARANPGVRVVYAGTRQAYGVPRSLPVNEDHPAAPVDYNGIHKFAAMEYHGLMSAHGGIDGCTLRLSNVYGPRMALDARGQGFLPAFLRQTLAGRPLKVFGDGAQLRDPMYAGDAVDAFLALGAARPLARRDYNAGGPEALSLFEIARVCHQLLDIPAEPELCPFPEDHKRFDIGSYVTDWRRLNADTGWRPRTPFREGWRRTLNHYRPEDRGGGPAPAA
jgi:nucleoside-diphosphate-sugar epimerase